MTTRRYDSGGSSPLDRHVYVMHLFRRDAVDHRPSVRSQQDPKQRLAPARHARPAREGLVRSSCLPVRRAGLGRSLPGSLIVSSVAYHGVTAGRSDRLRLPRRPQRPHKERRVED